MPDRLAAVRSRALAAQRGLPFVELGRIALSSDAILAAPFAVLKDLAAIPYATDGSELHVAFADPSPEAVAALERATGRKVLCALASRDDVDVILDELARSGTIDPEELHVDDLLDGDAPAVLAVTDILRAAVAAEASDVHLIPGETCFYVRLRIDGVVREHSRLDPAEAAAIVSRVKVLAGLDVAERRRPQDGRFGVRTSAGRPIDIRAAILPTVHGEGVVLRLLGKLRTPPSFTDLGLSNAMQMEIERMVDRAVGALLVTGPTGAGKSTTLHAALADLARPDRTVITVEDPVEYEVPGTYQLQVNPVAGLTFPSALRSVLRGDPDVLMVGEIRDHETAQLALSASLTGHFVLSTLHTGDAPTAVTRLVEMGVEHYVVGAALSGVIAQRLARRLCLYCRQPYEPSDAVLEAIGAEPRDEPRTYFRATGCAHCAGGYRGRTGVFQLLTIDASLRTLLAAGASHDAIAAAAAEAGMRSLWHDGLAKVEAGLISVEELTRVVPR
ncbi:MAG TPA: GspE/PulE family protein [Gaiellaceae bacterium]|nr:GspE/PulE family protein [Gaiellaceae bacterium]